MEIGTKVYEKRKKSIFDCIAGFCKAFTRYIKKMTVPV